MGVSVSVGEGKGESVTVGPTGGDVGDKVGKGFGFRVEVGLLAFSCSWGTKTTCSGGESAYLILAWNSSTRQANRLLTGGRL